MHSYSEVLLFLVQDDHWDRGKCFSIQKTANSFSHVNMAIMDTAALKCVQLCPHATFAHAVHVHAKARLRAEARQ